MRCLSLPLTFLPVLSHAVRTFVIVNGQIYTPGLAIVDAPQPFTPLGGATLHVALDVSGNGRLPPNTYQAFPNGTIPSFFALGDGSLRPLNGTFYHNITIFLSSYNNGHNFTVANNTLPPSEWKTSYVPPVLSLERGSTVKHVNWVWPTCMMKGMGEYNISIHQSFAYNGSDYYTIFDLPITMTNDLDPSRNATDCDLLNNPLLSPDELQRSANTLAFQPWVDGTGAQVDFDDSVPSSGKRAPALVVDVSSTGRQCTIDQCVKAHANYAIL
ncbi:hypothetical protein H072_5819 [Dactylellina haptotyla CBS 200.50]|uniref:Uncharacterized protein n=1 Tax=Dactylellina haptotyla (strain CBS 200.50) TaxID=1284197 RepID=S8BYG2_DACHA|nr:hypothetical protein H072_5819 [Dactylellina haptotyla CBS 200.50]